jgi:iron complex outermembrane receptor protein
LIVETRRARRGLRLSILFALVAAGAATPALGQERAAVTGRVVHRDGGTRLADVIVTLEGAGVSRTTDALGQFVFEAVPVGPQVFVATFLGFYEARLEVDVRQGSPELVLELAPDPILLRELTVTVLERAPGRVIDVPAAVRVLDRSEIARASVSGQAPKVLEGLPGIDVVESDAHDFNVNARGFNTVFNRRLLVLQDGRDLSISHIGSQEWNALSIPIEDMDRVEIVRGPGSALFGPNAYSGVLSLTSPAARQIIGTQGSVAAGNRGLFRADFRTAGVSSGGRFGYRVNVGYFRADGWSLSRTNLGDLAREYADAIDTSRYPVVAPFPGFELLPLRGQTLTGPFGQPGGVTGAPDPRESLYGSTRADYYGPEGAVATVEAGVSQVRNEVLASGVGRIQFTRAMRPWVRVAYQSEEWWGTVWYSGRTTPVPEISLASGTEIKETSWALQGEIQNTRTVFDDRMEVVLGGSARTTYVDSHASFLPAAEDGRRDELYAVFGQAKIELGHGLTFVAATRVDDGSLISTQFSPKAALAYQPREGHSIRATVNRAFQTPNIAEQFLSFPAGAPFDLSGLEAELRATLGPALANVPEGTLFSTSSSIPVMALGNRDLDVEKVVSLELGYAGRLSDRIRLRLDLFRSEYSDFVTDLLPGVNPAFGPWTAPPQVSAGDAEIVVNAVYERLSDPLQIAGLTRLGDGTTAVVLSRTNALEFSGYGAEIETSVGLADRVWVDVNYSYFDSSVDEATLVPGNSLLPNTPRHKANAALTFRPSSDIELSTALHFVAGFDWATGLLIGRVPSRQTLDLFAEYRIADHWTVQGSASNVLDQQRYQVFGGSIVGRQLTIRLSWDGRPSGS